MENYCLTYDHFDADEYRRIIAEQELDLFSTNLIIYKGIYEIYRFVDNKTNSYKIYLDSKNKK